MLQTCNSCAEKFRRGNLAGAHKLSTVSSAIVAAALRDKIPGTPRSAVVHIAIQARNPQAVRSRRTARRSPGETAVAAVSRCPAPGRGRRRTKCETRPGKKDTSRPTSSRSYSGDLETQCANVKRLASNWLFNRRFSVSIIEFLGVRFRRFQRLLREAARRFNPGLLRLLPEACDDGQRHHRGGGSRRIFWVLFGELRKAYGISRAGKIFRDFRGFCCLLAFPHPTPHHGLDSRRPATLERASPASANCFFKTPNAGEWSGAGASSKVDERFGGGRSSAWHTKATNPRTTRTATVVACSWSLRSRQWEGIETHAFGVSTSPT